MNGKEQPSQSAANAVMRVLVGKPLKYTVRVHRADGSVIEFQSDDRPILDFNTSARSLWINSQYDCPVMAYETGMVIITEENNPS